MDKNEIVRKVLLKPVDWITLTPMLVGASIGLGAWSLGQDTGIAVAAGVVLMILSAGIYLNRLLFGWNSSYQDIVNEWRSSMEQNRDRELDTLYKHLSSDGDPRTENMLKDLRTLTKALLAENSEGLATSAMDILTDVDKLFQRCVDYLKESLELKNTANAVARESIREPLLQHREQLIEEVEKSLENLGHVLGSVKKATVHSHEGQQLEELREELNLRLRVAEEVEERMAAMRKGRISAEDEAIYLQHAQP